MATEPKPGKDSPRGLHPADRTESGTTGDDAAASTSTPYDNGTPFDEVDEYGAERGGYGVGAENT